MLVEKFISEYKRASNKDEFFTRHIVNQYIPYEQKIAECKGIVDSTMYTTVDDKKIFKQNTPAQYLFFTCRLLLDYTDIEIPEGALFKVYNDLSQNGLIEPIITAIPKHEYDEFNTVLHMTVNDELENFRSFSGFLSTKFEVIDLVLKALQDAIPNEEAMRNIITKITPENQEEN